ncbi:MAG: DHH family phosphoesterase [archaeon GB-1867-005]|nr:DHH family phosphoesterase [Candidatus Culexmicrobium cathedralense]
MRKLDEIKLRAKIAFKKPKAIIITHSDVDGISCAAILKRYLKLKEKIDEKAISVIFSGPSSLLRVLSVIPKSSITLYITDISPNIIDEHSILRQLKQIKNHGSKITWIDHHKWRREYIQKLSNIAELILMEKAPSAARIVLEKFMPEDEISKKIAMYADDIDSLRDKFNESPILRILTYKSKWKKKLLKKFTQGIFFDDEIRRISDRLRKEAEAEVSKTIKRAIKMKTHNNLKFAIIDLRKVNLPKSWIARKISEKLDLDFIMVLRRNNAISLYVGSKGKEINLLPIAQKYGGGGHPYACGFRLKLSLKSKVLSFILGKKYIPNEVWSVIKNIKEII